MTEDRAQAVDRLKRPHSSLLVTILVISVVLNVALWVQLYFAKGARDDARRHPVYRRLLVEFRPDSKSQQTYFVWQDHKFSTGIFDAAGVEQVRITHGHWANDHTVKFEFQPGEQKECSKAYVLDLDWNGKNEILLDCGEARVISFSNERFWFDSKRDATPCGEGLLIKQLDNDPRPEVVVSCAFPQHFGGGEAKYSWQLEKVFYWENNRGFSEVSGQFSDYFHRVVIPTLQRRIEDLSEYPESQKQGQRAIEYIRKTYGHELGIFQ